MLFSTNTLDDDAADDGDNTYHDHHHLHQVYSATFRNGALGLRSGGGKRCKATL